VRVAFGEAFGIKPGKNLIGMITAALRKVGVDKVFDTTFAADLTIMEEATEFVNMLKSKKDFPLLTSCCPAWVRHVEQKYPQFISHLSTCRSPQQMFGAVAKELLSKEYGVKREDICVVSIMPCTAKKAEARRKEFGVNGDPDVDIVLTTQELIKMVKSGNINFSALEPQEMDSPFGVFSGAGVIFGASGGVAEAALRTAYKLVTGEALGEIEIKPLRGLKSFKEFAVNIKGEVISVAVVNTLSQASKLLEDIAAHKVHYHLVEVMACPGGCIAGAGQPYSIDRMAIREGRLKGLYQDDVDSRIRVSYENEEVQKLYDKWLQNPNSEIAHQFLHTHYHNRKRITGEDIGLFRKGSEVLPKTTVCVCVGTSCYVHGSYDFIEAIMAKIRAEGLEDTVMVKATFCLQQCGHGPNIKIDDQIISHATVDRVSEIFDRYIRVKYKK
ncbi:MAG: [Fe-Fe] hydrogenase large subunit C-terminal domain-containing protein, partial [Candidatus Omnitrophota bacterium]